MQTMDDMDGAKFSKLCRDCKLLNRSFTTIDVDLIFAKVKVKVGFNPPEFLRFWDVVGGQCNPGDTVYRPLSSISYVLVC